jgi:hypothetical protein
MTKKTLLGEITGVVETSPERVADLLLAVRPGPIGGRNAWLLSATGATGTLSGGPRVFTAHMTAHSMTVEVDESTLGLQGGWWYRGEYTVAPHPQGTLLSHRVLNVAQRMRWGVPAANRFFIGREKGQRDGLTTLLGRIGDELGCAAYLA